MEDRVTTDDSIMDDPRWLIRAFYHQVKNGCGDVNCEKHPCLTYRVKESKHPLRPPSSLTARSWALTLAIQPNARYLLCPTLRTLDVLAQGTVPEKLDRNSLEQAVMSTRTMNRLFDAASDLYSPARATSGSEESPSSVPRKSEDLTVVSHNLWPLPHPLVMARAWANIGERTKGGKIKAARQVSKKILQPFGYQTPTSQYQAAVVRTISLLRMQKAVQKADYHFDLIISPPQFFVNTNIGSLDLNREQQSALGVTRAISRYGLHSIVRRHLALQSSRLAPFAMVCDELSRVQKRQSVLPVRVKWMSLGDEGVDQGGVAQELFQEIAAEVSQPPLHLFTESEEGSGFIYINPGAGDPERLNAFECFGAMMALAIHNGFMLPVHLPLIFYEILQEQIHPTKRTGPGWRLEYLEEAWPKKAKSLELMLEQSINDAAISYAFEVDLPVKPGSLDGYEVDEPPRPDEKDLPNSRIDRQEHWKLSIDMQSEESRRLRQGDGFWDFESLQRSVKQRDYEIEAGDVTDDNKAHFVDEIATWTVFESVRAPHYYIRQGIISILPPHLIDSITPEALRLLVEGESKITYETLEPVVSYDYDTGLGQIAMFWAIIRSWDAHRVKQLLRFITGSDRLPVGCERHKNPAFTIRDTHGSEDKLPTASTCVKYLYLPHYETPEQMEAKLVYAIENTSTFGLA